MEIIAPTRKLLDAACFYAKLLKIDSKDFTIEIECKSLLKEDAVGTCMFLEEDKYFIIELEKKRKNREGKSPSRVLAHEMVHVAQYATGKLKLDELSGTIWNGKAYMGTYSLTDGYWDAPWEIEAYGREVGLYHRYELYKAGQYELKGE